MMVTMIVAGEYAWCVHGVYEAWREWMMVFACQRLAGGRGEQTAAWQLADGLADGRWQTNALLERIE